jgi:hypothetical protein
MVKSALVLAISCPGLSSIRLHIGRECPCKERSGSGREFLNKGVRYKI